MAVRGHRGEGAADLVAPNLREFLPLVVNETDEAIGQNVRDAMRRDLPVVDFLDAHGTVALLVGGGPSLSDDIEDIRQRQKDGGKIFALNGAAKFLLQHDIAPDFVVVLDARKHNARFVTGLPDSTKLYLASQCAPEVFDACARHEIVMWHAPTGGLSGVVETRPAAFILGGQNVGIRAMSLALVLGYRTMHLYGYDSSYRGDDAHAYPQVENSRDRLIEAYVNGNKFYTTPWMARQADDFRDIAPRMIELGVNLHVHGYGLLPAVAEEMFKPVARAEAATALTVFYDLHVAPPSYDFLTTLAMAEQERISRGLDSLTVVIVPADGEGTVRHFLDDAAIEQFKWNVFGGIARCLPSIKEFVICETRAAAVKYLTEDRFPIDYDVDFPTDRYGMKRTLKAMRKSDISCFRAPDWCLEQVRRWIKPHTVTITLREAGYGTWRNSNPDEWRRAADELKAAGWNVVIVRDTAEAFGADFFGHDVFHPASHDVAMRLALYECAELNLFSANGPMTLAMLAPKVNGIVFDMIHNAPGETMTPAHWQSRGLPVGSQLPQVSHRFSIHWGRARARTIARKAQDFRATERPFLVCYDLSKLPANFDAATWLVLAEMARRREGSGGRLKVAFKPGPNGGFRNDGLPHSSIERSVYLTNIVRPMLGMIGAESVELTEETSAGREFPYLIGHVSKLARDGEVVPRLTAPREILDIVDEWLEQFVCSPIVITLREASHWPQRNSDLDEWLKAAARIKLPVVFVRDTEKADDPLPYPTCPLASKDLNFRMGLYERAKINLFTACGPAMLGVFSDYPYLLFGPLVSQEKTGWPAGTPEWWAKVQGTPVGSNFVWANEYQRIVWDEPTADVIVTHCERLLSDLDSYNT